MTRVHPKAFAIWFEDLDLWSPKSYFEIDWKWPKETIKPLSAALERRQEVVNKKKSTFADAPPVTLRFEGSVEVREVGNKTSFKGNLFAAYSEDVVYSKIDVRNGAISIVPESLPLISVTSEFPIYEVKPEIAIPEYVQILFKTDVFRERINSIVSGASGRKRVQPGQLETIKVPLPPLETQRAIVQQWQEGQAEAERLEAQADLAQSRIETILTDALSLKPAKSKSKPKAFAISWEFIDRWSVSYNLSKLSGTNLESGKFQVFNLGELLEMLQYGTSEKANTQEVRIPILRMNNIQDGVMDLSNIKHIKLSAKERDKLTLKPGDILFNRTNSRELVGKCAVFGTRGEYVFASYCIRVRLNHELADSNYIAIFINSALGREQIT